MYAIRSYYEMKAALPSLPLTGGRVFNMEVADWFELRNMLQVAECVARGALARTESRGAQQREDFPGLDEDWA